MSLRNDLYMFKILFTQSICKMGLLHFTWVLVLTCSFVTNVYSQGPRNALNFDGVDDRVVVQNSGTAFSFSTQDFTIECWFRANSAAALTNSRALINKWAFQTNIDNYGIFLNNNRVVVAYGTGNQNPEFQSSTVLQHNIWYHVALVRQGGIMRLFLNGVLETTHNVVGTLNTNTLPLTFGFENTATNTNTRHFNGAMDEIRIWSVARTNNEIANNWRNSVANNSANLLGYWRFDHGVPGANNNGITQVDDLTGNGYNATLSNFSLNGNTSNWIASHAQIGHPGNALSFDGIDDRVEIQNSGSAFSFTSQDFTIECWFRANSLAGITGVRALISKWAQNSPTDNYSLFVINSQFVFIYTNGSLQENSLTSTSTVEVGRWYHVALVRSGGSMFLYVNGTLEVTHVVQGIMNTNNLPLTFGFEGFGINQAQRHIGGSIDEVRIWTIARTAQQIQDNWQVPVEPVQSNLLGYWRFDQGVAGGNNAGLLQVHDLTGNGYHATLSNFALSGSSGNWVESFAMVRSFIQPASQIGTRSFQANWSTPITGSFDHYILEVSQNSNFSSLLSGYPATIASNTNTTTINGLQANTNYFYRVRPNKTSVNEQALFSNGSQSTVENSVWNGTTWNPTVPNSIIDANINSSLPPPGNFSAARLTIQNGHSLNTQGLTIGIHENIVNNGNGISGNGTVQINGNTILSGNLLNVSSRIHISNDAQLQTGDLLQIQPTGSITGNYNNIQGITRLQQSIAAQRGWRVVAHPFSSNSTITSIATNNGIHLNTVAGNSPVGLTDVRAFSNSTNTWSNLTSQVLANQAYTFFYRGLSSESNGLGYTDPLIGPSNLQFTTSGNLNGNSINIQPQNENNFILVGNPYVGPVSTIALTGGIPRNYFTYQIQEGANITERRTAAGSWIVAASVSNASTTVPILGAIAFIPGSTNVYQIQSSDISLGQTPITGIFQSSQEKNNKWILEVFRWNRLEDRLIFQQSDKSMNHGSDSDDLPKMYNPSVNLFSSTSDLRNLAIDCRPTWKDNYFDLVFQAPAGTYEFRINELPTIENMTWQFTDKIRNHTYALHPNQSILIHLDRPLTSHQSSFEIKLIPKQQIPSQPSAHLAYTVITNRTVQINQTNSNSGLVRLLDLNGRVISSQVLPGNTQIKIQLPSNLKRGWYIAEIIEGTRRATERFIITD